jgi:hypothetical protein
MRIFNSFVCPQCNNCFPIFIRPSLRINRGLLTPYLKCPECGQVCRQKINFRRALWIWPLTICFFVAVVYLLRMFLYSEARILYIIAVIVAFFPVFIGYRLGLKLVRVEKPDVRQRKSYKWFIPAGGLVLFSLLFGYYTRDWINVAIGIIVGLIVWAFFYRFFGNKEKGKE